MTTSSGAHSSIHNLPTPVDNTATAQSAGLSETARRDLAALRRGEVVDLTYGSYRQLLDAGLVDGPQDAPELAERAS